VSSISILHVDTERFLQRLRDEGCYATDVEVIRTAIHRALDARDHNSGSTQKMVAVQAEILGVDPSDTLPPTAEEWDEVT
jgi:Arc/MetJ-type ribon-helix-helix transcriptional regulator